MEELKESTAPATSTRPAPTAEPSRDRERNGQQKRGRFPGVRAPRVCPFCKADVDYIDYKQADSLRRYLTERGKIKARRKIGTCARHQRRLAVAIKRARHVALLPFIAEHVRGE